MVLTSTYHADVSSDHVSQLRSSIRMQGQPNAGSHLQGANSRPLTINRYDLF